MTELHITKTTNGYVLLWMEEAEDGSGSSVQHVIEERGGEDAKEKYGTTDTEKVAMGRMLYAVAEHFGYQYQKFEEENLNIDFKLKGHKLDV